MAIIPSKTKLLYVSVDGRAKKIRVNNSPQMIEKLKQAEKYRLMEKKYQLAKNRLLWSVKSEQHRLAKLQGAD